MEAKLKPQDLRIGNYIKRKGIVVQVDHQTFWDIKNKPEEYEPIPLTEGWLFSADFTNDDDESWFYSLDFNQNCETFKIFPLTAGGQPFGLWGIVACSQLAKKIEFVNQLQNVFHSLTGQELKIDLK